MTSSKTPPRVRYNALAVKYKLPYVLASWLCMYQHRGRFPGRPSYRLPARNLRPSHLSRSPRSPSEFGILLLFRRDAHRVSLDFDVAILQLGPQPACHLTQLLNLRSEFFRADRLLSVSGTEVSSKDRGLIFKRHGVRKEKFSDLSRVPTGERENPTTMQSTCSAIDHPRGSVDSVCRVSQMHRQ